MLPATSAAAQSIERNVVYGIVSGTALLLDVHQPTVPNGFGVLYLGKGGWASAPEYSATGLKETAHIALVTARYDATDFACWLAETKLTRHER